MCVCGHHLPIDPSLTGRCRHIGLSKLLVLWFPFYFPLKSLRHKPDCHRPFLIFWSRFLVQPSVLLQTGIWNQPVFQDIPVSFSGHSISGPHLPVRDLRSWWVDFETFPRRHTQKTAELYWEACPTLYPGPTDMSYNPDYLNSDSGDDTAVVLVGNYRPICYMFLR